MFKKNCKFKMTSVTKPEFILDFLFLVLDLPAF